jgi:hypothetical protein
MADLGPAEIAAYIGAAAWAPQIGSWMYGWLVKPRVQILPERMVEVGFTTLGPIFNIRLALSASKKDAIIDHLEVELRHGAGDSHVLSWIGLRETFTEIVDTAGNRQSIEKDQPAIAPKVTTAVLLEKLVRFHDLGFRERQRPVLNSLVEHLNYLRGQHADYRFRALKSRQAYDLFELCKSSFLWKPGEYTVHFRIKSRDGAVLDTAAHRFTLVQHDADALRFNLDLVKTEYENIIKSDLPDYQFKAVRWNWRDVPLTPV